MKPNQKSPLDETERLYGLEAASERLDQEVDKFVDFIEAQNPGIDIAPAIWTAVICLEQLPTLFSNNPDLMERLRAIATELSVP